MKANFILLFFVATSFLSCTQDTTEQELLNKDNSFLENSRQLDQNPPPISCPEVDLIAGQNYDAGNVLLNVNNGFLTVTYQSQDDWEIDETHLYVGPCDEIPMNKKGNPKIGLFPLSGNHPDGTTNVVYTIDLNELGDCGCIAAHAVVSIDVPGLPHQAETAWGNGTSFPGNNWAMYFDFCVSQCQPNNY